MKTFTKIHKEKLSKLNVEAFKEKCVKDLKSLKLGKYAYPPQEEDIVYMVEEGYKHSKNRIGLKTQKEIKISLIAIYLGGIKFLHNQEYNIFLQNKEITNEQKIEFLEEYIDKSLDILEGEMNNE